METLIVDTMPLSKEPLKDEKTDFVDFKMVTFSLAGKDYGVDIMHVKEIQKGNRFTRVPNVSHFVRGVYNLRGDIIPVIDLRAFFGLPELESKVDIYDILILRQDTTVVGVIVDSILKVVGINSQDIQPAHPLFSDVVGLRYIYGVTQKEEKVYVILDATVLVGTQKQEEKAIEASSTTAQKELVSNTIIPEQVQQLPSPPQPLPLEQLAEVVSSSVQLDTQQEPFAPAVQLVEEGPKASSELSVPTQVILPESDPAEVFYLGLYEQTHFCPSELNQEWLCQQYETWSKEHPGFDAKLDSKTAGEFLHTFYSAYNTQLWPKEMVDDFLELVSQNEQKITHIWDVGCGQGFSAYSMAGSLFLNQKKCKIYATESDLLKITSAQDLTFQEPEIPVDLKAAMVEGRAGWQFSNDVKNTIIFEYHDIANKHSFPKLDIILVRDQLSFVNEEVFMNFFDRLFNQTRPGTLLIIGDHEKLMEHRVWAPVESRYFSAYRKVV